jgi:predicted transcriptional regulator
MDDIERLEAEWLKDPAYRKALERRRPAHELARTMIRIRVAAGLTQQELADRTGMAQPDIARMESGDHFPTWKRLARVLAAVGASAEVRVTSTNGQVVSLALPVESSDVVAPPRVHRSRSA